MNNRFAKASAPGWRERLLTRVQEREAKSVTEYAERRPYVSLIEIASDLGDDIAAIQIEKLLFKEARASNTLNSCIKHNLVRKLHAQLPEGWGNGDNFDFRSGSAYASWNGPIDERHSDLAFKVWERLRDAPPPADWLPDSPQDTILVQAFADADFTA